MFLQVRHGPPQVGHHGVAGVGHHPGAGDGRGQSYGAAGWRAIDRGEMIQAGIEFDPDDVAAGDIGDAGHGDGGGAAAGVGAQGGVGALDADPTLRRPCRRSIVKHLLTHLKMPFSRGVGGIEHAGEFPGAGVFQVTVGLVRRVDFQAG